jgi:hypothetical protein
MRYTILFFLCFSPLFCECVYIGQFVALNQQVAATSKAKSDAYAQYKSLWDRMGRLKKQILTTALNAGTESQISSFESQMNSTFQMLKSAESQLNVQRKNLVSLYQQIDNMLNQARQDPNCKVADDGNAERMAQIPKLLSLANDPRAGRASHWSEIWTLDMSKIYKSAEAKRKRKQCVPLMEKYKNLKAKYRSAFKNSKALDQRRNKKLKAVGEMVKDLRSQFFKEGYASSKLKNLEQTIDKDYASYMGDSRDVVSLVDEMIEASKSIVSLIPSMQYCKSVPKKEYWGKVFSDSEKFNALNRKQLVPWYQILGMNLKQLQQKYPELRKCKENHKKYMSASDKIKKSVESLRGAIKTVNKAVTEVSTQAVKLKQLFKTNSDAPELFQMQGHMDRVWKQAGSDMNLVRTLTPQSKKALFELKSYAESMKNCSSKANADYIKAQSDFLGEVEQFIARVPKDWRGTLGEGLTQLKSNSEKSKRKPLVMIENQTTEPLVVYPGGSYNSRGSVPAGGRVTLDLSTLSMVLNGKSLSTKQIVVVGGGVWKTTSTGWTHLEGIKVCSKRNFTHKSGEIVWSVKPVIESGCSVRGYNQ